MNSSTILVYGIIVCILGIALVGIVYYFWKVRSRSDLGSYGSVPLSQNGRNERRSSPRANIHWPVSMETRDGTRLAEIISISLNGAFICCEEPLSLGEVFHLTLTGPNNEAVTATAQVVWSNANVPSEKVVNRGMGVRFIKMSDTHIKLVRETFKGKDS